MRRLASSAPFEDVKLPSNDSYFAFDGTNSDLARQLFFRAKAGDSAAQFKNFSIPSAVQDRLNKLELDWSKLPGIAQRALLWDLGFGITKDNSPVQIWTLNGHSMADLAVPLPQFQAAGCTEKVCEQPGNTTSFSNLWCGGAQMLKVARCVVEDFADDDEIHAAMWVTGGNPAEVPTLRVRKHEWKDKRDGNSYVVFAVHTLELADEPSWNSCALATQNDGYGSLVLPCYTTGNITDGPKQRPQTGSTRCYSFRSSSERSSSYFSLGYCYVSENGEESGVVIMNWKEHWSAPVTCEWKPEIAGLETLETNLQLELSAQAPQSSVTRQCSRPSTGQMRL
ncbi:hypothetical protein PF005_g17526 [Phytophthora fragariae]|uniref:Uncharacterized protein n=1 Tax=Phytophthora fragariae TaxID=53985 RepID=A0A6A4CWA5_9STRA|nr:hypothetical protein PF003_g20284 [Phytophthora fragariae]KAE9094190.1 hypothetical protein PF010_g17202 [Phytophthora fragariae]KAE9194835.1 hypothetical protein PF005_g17526 [Phytophthora fragariae]KAE9208527.1 hypothetical protein PF004_g16732 [Phytophthora fragariae]KAE9209964.1 hypothetical protein PF002_g18956 [Phytophthora fragariae]